MITLFIILFLLLFYTFLGYYLLLKVISSFKSRPIKKGDYYPETALLIPVYNGEKVIQEKLESCLKIDYPRDKLKLTVISDASTDKTDEIASAYKDKAIEFMRLEKRGGKTKALNLALRNTQSELVFFTDASTQIKEDSIKKIAKNFKDPSVGCVSGEDRSILPFSGKSSSGEGLYVDLEMQLRRLESAIGNLTGVSGCLYAIRRELLTEIPHDLIDDFYLPLQVMKKGKRVISELEGIAFVARVTDYQEEFRRRRRTTLGGLEVFFSELSLLNPFKYGFFSLELFSHKLLRWLTPFFLLLLFLTNLFLLGVHFIFNLTFTLGLLSILISLAYWLFLTERKPRGIFSILESVFYFYLVNLAIFIAWVKFLLGKREIIWEPSKR